MLYFRTILLQISYTKVLKKTVPRFKPLPHLDMIWLP